MCHLVLDGKDVLKRSVVTFGPDVVSVGRIDQLRRDTDAVSHLAHAALEHVAHAELAPDLAYVDGLALVGEWSCGR